MKQHNQIDPLAVYYTQIARYPLLSKQEEVALLLRVQQGDSQAASELANANTRFVIKTAKKYVSSGVPLLDLISEGNIGLIQAIECFDPTRIGKVRLITYASWWIKQKIHCYIHESSRNVKTSSGLDLSLKKLYKVGVVPRNSIGGKLFLDPEDICNAIGSKNKEQISELNRLFLGDLSLQNKNNEDGSLEDILPDKTELQDISYENEELREKLYEHLKFLTDKEQEIIINYFGLGENIPRTLLDLGQSLGISKERIRQIKEEALKKLKTFSGLKELLR